MEDTFIKVFIAAGVVIFAAILALLFAFPLMWCWNYVMPYLFQLPELNWGRAWCLLFLSNFLIKSTLIGKN
jgi:hypothetical protein